MEGFAAQAFFLTSRSQSLESSLRSLRLLECARKHRCFHSLGFVFIHSWKFLFEYSPPPTSPTLGFPVRSSFLLPSVHMDGTHIVSLHPHSCPVRCYFIPTYTWGNWGFPMEWCHGICQDPLLCLRVSWCPWALTEFSMPESVSVYPRAFPGHWSGPECWGSMPVPTQKPLTSD